MSQENVEVLLRMNRAFNEGDVSGAMHFFSPDAELRDLAGGPDQAEVVKGLEAIREVWTLWTAAFDELRADIEHWKVAGEAVVSRVRWHGFGKASGMSIDVRQFDLYELQDGQVTRATLGFKTEEDALASL